MPIRLVPGGTEKVTGRSSLVCLGNSSIVLVKVVSISSLLLETKAIDYCSGLSLGNTGGAGDRRRVQPGWQPPWPHCRGHLPQTSVAMCSAAQDGLLHKLPARQLPWEF